MRPANSTNGNMSTSLLMQDKLVSPQRWVSRCSNAALSFPQRWVLHVENATPGYVVASSLGSAQVAHIGCHESGQAEI
eukprot:1161059-Pelagomonas_calceolata.AAC.10